MCKSLRGRYLSVFKEVPILVKIAKFRQNTRAQVIRHRRVACLRVFGRLAMPTRMWTVARFFCIEKFPRGCGGSQNISCYEMDNFICGNMFLPVVFIRSCWCYRMGNAINRTKPKFHIRNYAYLFAE